jgi:hypothetical protein
MGTGGAHLRRSQPMPERKEDHRRVAVPIPSALTRGLNKQLDFLDSKIFAWPTRGIRHPADLVRAPDAAA